MSLGKNEWWKQAKIVRPQGSGPLINESWKNILTDLPKGAGNLINEWWKVTPTNRIFGDSEELQTSFSVVLAGNAQLLNGDFIVSELEADDFVYIEGINLI